MIEPEEPEPQRRQYALPADRPLRDLSARVAR